MGEQAHGGHAVARLDSRVVFVRHAIPGERVRARITEGGPGASFLRADAVEVLRASPDRVAAPCRYAGPGGCGGCDLQHVDLTAQRALKAAVVSSTMARVGRMALGEDVWSGRVEPVPGDVAGLGWRTRVEYAVDPVGRPGLRRHRSHEVLAVAECLIATEVVRRSTVLERAWPSHRAVDVVAPSGGPDPGAVVVPLVQRTTGPGAGGANDPPVPTVVEHVRATGMDRRFEVSARGFWQVHPGAAATLVDAVLDALGPRPGERAVDLYAGVGLFAAALGQAVGAAGQVVAVEVGADASRLARGNLADLPCVVVDARVDDALGVARSDPRRRGRGRRRAPGRPRRHRLVPSQADLVVLDPPRTGAGRGVVEAVAAMAPRAVAYVACDPAALARDAAYLQVAGYTLVRLRAFDAFPMTHHVECVAIFEPAPQTVSPDEGQVS